MAKYIIIGLAVIALGIGGYFLIANLPDTTTTSDNGEELVTDNETTNETDEESVPTAEVEGPTTVLGTSVEGREIVAYHYPPKGEANENINTDLLFVGGFHGGYSWNTTLVAYELMDYLKNNPGMLPENIRVTVIPVLNPDGLNKVVGANTETDRFTRADVPSSASATISGRFNANGVDLNRNFDCDWRANATWQNRSVSGGTSAFSEPESAALRDYINTNRPNAVIVWYSAAGGVFSSNCHNGVLGETRTIVNVFAKASGYPAHEEFNFYEITGDATNWLAKNNIPTISVLLTTHEDIEWNKNKAGIDALIEHYTE